jgi:hypothetical protein
MIQNYFISIISDPDSGSLHETVENEALCASASTLRLRKRAMADGDTEWIDVVPVPDTVVYPGSHGVEQEVGVDESRETLDFFLHFINSELIAKTKEQTNLYASQKIAALHAQNKLSPSCRLRLWTTVILSERITFLGIL